MVDENMYGDVVGRLRTTGHDVSWVAEDNPSTPEPNVLARASREGRVLVTMDVGDFGNLVFAAGADAQGGVVLFRFRITSTSGQMNFITGILDSDTPWAGRLSVIRTSPSSA